MKKEMSQRTCKKYSKIYYMDIERIVLGGKDNSKYVFTKNGKQFILYKDGYMKDCEAALKDKRIFNMDVECGACKHINKVVIKSGELKIERFDYIFKHFIFICENCKMKNDLPCVL